MACATGAGGAAGGAGRRRKLSRTYIPWLLLTPALVILVPFPLYLLAAIVRNSLFDWTLTMPWLGELFVGLGNFRNILGDADSLHSIVTALGFTLGTLAVELGLGISVGHLLIRETRLMSTLRGFILLPLVITPVVVGLLWRMMYQGDLGIITYLLGVIGFPKMTILAHLQFALPAVIVVSIWQNAPFLILVTVAGLKALPTEPFEAALIDGASGWQVFRLITIPLLRPLLYIVLLIRFIDAFRQFDLIYIMTGGGPGIRTETISMHIFREGFLVFHMGYAAALTIVLIFVVNLFAILYFTTAARGARTGVA